MTVYSRTAQFETMLSLSVTHSCLLNFIELRRWPSREALYRATLQRAQRPNISVAPTVWTFLFEKKKSPFSHLLAQFALISGCHTTPSNHLVRKKKKRGRFPRVVSSVSFATRHSRPITTIHTTHVCKSPLSCARSGQSTTAALRVSKPASFLFSVRVCDLLEWMPAAPLHTCPHLHASNRLVCRWASVLGGHSVFSFRLKPRFVRGFLSYKPVSPCSW